MLKIQKQLVVLQKNQTKIAVVLLKKSTPCHDTSKKSQSCNSNCAKCTSCSLSVVFLGEETDKSLSEISSHAISNKVENLYLAPYLSQLSIAIWQPPKIG